MVVKFERETSVGVDVDVVGDCDRISNLPEEIVCHILSLLPTIRDVIRTSILSRVWRNVWVCVPIIRFAPHEKHSDTQFKIGNIEMLVPITQPKAHVKEMYLDFPCGNYKAFLAFLPSICLAYQNLAVLKLHGLMLKQVPRSFCHPCLKKLSLHYVLCLDVSCINKLLTGCPVLEDLHIERFGDDNLASHRVYVQSSSLKSFTFYSRQRDNCNSRVSKLVINASNLERLDLYFDIRERVEVRCSLSSLVKVGLSINKMYAGDVCRTRLLDLLRNLSNTKYLYLSTTSECKFMELRRLNYQLLIFNNLTHLETKLCGVGLSILLCLSCPNLISCNPISKDIFEHQPPPSFPSFRR